MIPVFLCLEIFLSVAAVLCLLLPPPARGDVGSCWASLVCLFSLSWNTCGFSAQFHAAGGPSGVPLLADSGWLLYSCSVGSHGVGGCLVTVGLFPPCFLFCACAASPSAASPSGFCPLSEWVGMSVSSLLVYSSVGWRGLAVTFSSVPVRCFPCCRYIGIFGLLLLRFAGVVGALLLSQSISCWDVVCLVCRRGSPCCLSLILEWVYFWLRRLQSLWATKAVSAALRGSSSSSGVCWSISFFWSWGGFWSLVGGSSCDSCFWSLLLLGHTFLMPSPLPLLPSLAVGWPWRLFFLALCLWFVLLASRVGCWLVVIEVFP